MRILARFQRQLIMVSRRSHIAEEIIEGPVDRITTEKVEQYDEQYSVSHLQKFVLHLEHRPLMH